LHSEEAHDRNDISIAEDKTRELLQRSKKKGKKSILVLSIPGPTVIPSKDDVDAILVNFYAGEKMSEALFDIIEGKVNPSGKLPNTMPNS
jgi:beta-glucosidase